MQRASFATMGCPLARAVDAVGDAWTLLILREAFLGGETFGDFAEHLPIAPTTLTRKLEALVAHDLLARVTYQDHPPRDAYRLTAKARELLPVLIALGEWGNRWLAPDGPLPTLLTLGKPPTRTSRSTR
jgi:DNA-binding HxlR family transcriptional regulator